MGRCKDGLIGCSQCGVMKDAREWLSLTGLCPHCGEINLVDWIRGMKDPESVVRKIWRAAFDVSIPGRIRKYTPPAELISQLRLNGK